MIPTLPRSLTALAPWVTAGVFGPGEVHAAEVITRADTQLSDLVVLGAALALWAPLHGHVCVDLGLAEAMVRAEAPDDPQPVIDTLAWPTIDAWLHALSASNIVRVAHAVDLQPVLDDRPLVLSGQRLYTQRQWVDECIVATALRSRALAESPINISAQATALLERLLPISEQGQPNLQHSAARAALSARFAVIVGGPGTGKTHTVARLLAVLLADSAETGLPLRIALAAPTGKAATRLREAITTAARATEGGSPVLPDTIADQLAQLPAVTLHRLLGPRGMVSTRFVQSAINQLPHDIIVVDETSMVALPLMARLLEAIRPEARLILVGDPDQLESIDVGAVLADIDEAAHTQTSPMHAHVVRLRRPRRQQSGSPIAPLADAIRDNRADDVVSLLRAGANESGTLEPLLSFIEHPDALSAASVADLRDVIVTPFADSLAHARAGQSGDALRALASMRVLCAHRQGPHGAQRWNQTIETWLLGKMPQTRFYPGRALLITRNDPRTRLSNGDTGVVVKHVNDVRAAFRIGDLVHEFAPAQLESVETAFAMTIHKSQGSEYSTVVVVLPPATSPLIGRELLYTAVTRTTRRLIVVGTVAAVIAAVQTPGRRITGLTAALV